MSDFNIKFIIYILFEKMKFVFTVLATLVGITQSNDQILDAPQLSTETCAKKAALYEKFCGNTPMTLKQDLPKFDDGESTAMWEGWFDVYGEANRASALAISQRYIWVWLKGERDYTKTCIFKRNGDYLKKTKHGKSRNTWSMDAKGQITVGSYLMRLQASNSGRFRLRMINKKNGKAIPNYNGYPALGVKNMLY